MEYDKIEQVLISSITEDDPHKVSKQLQIKQWTKLYGVNLLRSSTPDKLNFIVQVISDKDCWVKVNSLEGVQLNRSKVGKKLLTSKTPNGDRNPFDKMQKYQIACWCCFEDKITKLGNQLKQDDTDIAHGLLVKYWTLVKLNKNKNNDDKMEEFYRTYLLAVGYPVDLNSIELHCGFQSAIRDNNKEALEYFLNKLKEQKLLSEVEKNDVLIYTATHYCLPMSKANNEKVGFVMDHLDQEQYDNLLNKDIERNKQYSTLYNLISNFEFDKAKKLAEILSGQTSNFDYDILKNRVLHQISSLVNSSNKFCDAGYELLELLESLNMSSNALLQNSDNIIHNTEVITLDQTAIETASKKISYCGDDSSDEEDTVMSYDIKKAKKALKKCQASIASNKYQIHDWKSSFIAHAISIKLLYSPKIQKSYYQRKSKYNYKLPNYYELCTAVDHSADQIAATHSKYTKQEVIYDICKTINASPWSFLRSIFNRTLGDFFKELLKPKGKYLTDVLSYGNGYTLEVRTCHHLIVKYGIPKKHESDHQESYLNGVFDISDSQSHFPTNFFSTLRLYNRLEKRKLRGSSYNSPGEPIKWKYSDKIEVKIDNKRKKPQYRSDWVEFGELGRASYETIYEKVSFTMQDLEALPTIFTIGVEAVKKISSNAASLHFLLFGIEVIRNPSALIHDMMILDLIKGGKLTWESALKNNYMPMSMKKSSCIMACRLINSLFNENYMPHKHLYEDKTYEEYSRTWNPDKQQKLDKVNSSNARGLIQKEKTLTRAWCEMKWLDANQYFEKDSNDIKDTKVEWLFNELQKSCKTWYDIDIIGDDGPSNA